MTTPTTTRLLVCTAGLLWTAAARAQVIDYQGLGAMVGEPVTASVTGKLQRASTAPASIVVITREQIMRSSARSVPDLLRSYTGVTVSGWTAGQRDVAVRGGVQPNNPRLLVLVDGRQVYLDHYGMTDWNLLGIPLEAIQQIELVYGPASALFGFNAASGVVNIITIDPSSERKVTATAESGTHGYSRVSIVASGAVGDHVALRLTTHRQREDERTVPDTIGRPAVVRGVIADAIGGTMIVTPDPATKIAVEGGRAFNRQLEFLPSAALSEQRYRTDSTGVTVDRDTNWGSITGKAYANWLRADYGSTGSAPGSFYDVSRLSVQNRIIVARLSTLGRLGATDTARVGFEYRNDQVYSQSLFAPRVGYQDAAANAMLDLHPASWSALTLAGRVDHLWLGRGGMPPPDGGPQAEFDRSLTRFSFNAAALFDVGSTGQLRVNGGRGFQSPSLLDLGIRARVSAPDAPVAIYAIGNPALYPAMVWSGEVAYVLQLRTRTRIETTAFFVRVDKAITRPGGPPPPDGGSRPAGQSGESLAGGTKPSSGNPPASGNEPALFNAPPRGNAPSFDTFGVSLSARGRLGAAMSWNAGYTWSQVRDGAPSGAPPEPGGSMNLKVTIPRHAAHVGVDLETTQWFGSARAHFASATQQFAYTPAAALSPFYVPAAVGIDAKIGYRVCSHLDAYAAGENLSAAMAAAGSPIAADRRLRVGVSYRL